MGQLGPAAMAQKDLEAEPHCLAKFGSNLAEAFLASWFCASLKKKHFAKSEFQLETKDFTCNSIDSFS